jgi:S-phase kinase-associated protein 1
MNLDDLEENNEIILVSNDPDSKQRFTLSKKAASLSGFLQTIIKSDQEVTEIEVDIEAVVLRKITEYLVHHDGKASNKIQTPLRTTNLKSLISSWDDEFIESFDRDNLIKLVNASNYFNINCLLYLGCAKIATQVKDKTPSEIKTLFNGSKNTV